MSTDLHTTESPPETPSAGHSVGLQRQEIRIMLILGLANGFIIGAFFVVYIVLAIVFGETTTFSPHA